MDIESQFQSGTLRAYFAENAAQGKGLPVWIYYSQWIYWPPLLLDSLGVGPLVSLKIVYCGLLLTCCAGCYRLLKLHSDGPQAVLGTLLFVTSNYVIGEIFQRSAYAEFFSVAMLPFLLCALNGVLRHGGTAKMAAVVLFSAVMILSHPLSFMNSGYAVVAYGVYVGLRWQLPARRFLTLCALLLLALAITAFYWLPAVVETRFVLGAEGVPTPLRETFLTIPSYFRFHSILSLGFVLTLCLIAGGVGLLVRSPAREARVVRSSWPLVAGMLIYLYLTLPISEPLYAHISFLASNLWVWRVLFPLTLLAVIFIVSNYRWLPRQLRKDALLDAIAVLAVLQATVFVLFYTVSDISIRRVPIGHIEGELAKEERRLEGFGIDEYLPQPRLLPRPETPCPSVRTVAPAGLRETSFVIEKNDIDRCIHLPRYWNTRYLASIDGEELPVLADPDDEVLLVPEDRSGIVTVRFGRPDYVRFSDYLSAASAIVLLLFIAWSLLRGHRVKASVDTG